MLWSGVLQNYARKYTIAIDDVGFESLPMKEKKEDVTKAPDDGVYVMTLCSLVHAPSACESWCVRHLKRIVWLCAICVCIVQLRVWHVH
jgi:hypothetical protein